VEVTDGELVGRVLEGDPDAFGVLVDRHYPACLRFADRLVGNRADAEEAVQDTFVRAYRALGRYRDQQRLRSWLFRILVNRCRTQASRAERRFRMDHTAGEEMGSPVESPVAFDDELSPALRSALATLPAVQREALLLKHVEELSYEEMAAITGARVSALKMRVKRALESLSRALGPGPHGS
jgi:RNA polymerase sigma-70 factor (ECF subfamily)